MPQPCSGPRASVLRISRSSVPCRSSVDSAISRDTLSFDNSHDRAAIVECQGIVDNRRLPAWTAARPMVVVALLACTTAGTATISRKNHGFRGELLDDLWNRRGQLTWNERTGDRAR